MAKTPNKGAQAAKNVAREARKAANPKSLRGQVRSGVMTRAEAVEQATIRRAGVQAAGRRATAGRAVERGVQERAARVVTRKAEQKAVAGMAQRAASSTLRGRAATAGKAILGRAAAPVTAFTTGYAVGGLINEYTPVQKMIANAVGDGGKMSADQKKRNDAMVVEARRRRAGAAKPASKPAATPAAAAKPASKPVAKSKPAAAQVKPASTSGTAIKRMKPEMTVQDVKQTIAPMENTGLSPRKRDIKIGSVAGRTGGKWHLGKRPGKG